MTRNRLFPATFLLPLLMIASCGGSKKVEIDVSNPTGDTLGMRIVELSATPVFERIGSGNFYVTDSEGNEIPSQLTYDSLIIFSAEAAPGETRRYTVHPSDTPRTYRKVVYGNFYPKRRDDIAFENELTGYRIYGPGTQRAGERSLGYDLFLKHPTEELIVPELYALETDDATWARVDSLRKIDPKLAEEYVNSFSYHIDHGLGMDCYAVGATLGAGLAAPLVNDSINFPWCYESAEILDNGPLRFSLAMQFAPRAIGNSPVVVERRLITLDSQSHLNGCKVWYTGLQDENLIVAGFPLRDDSEVMKDTGRGIITYADPTQGPDNGKALVGVVFEVAPDSIINREGHVLMARSLAPSDTLSYHWGFAWDRTDITSLADWKDYLDKSKLNYTVTVK